jgi:nucleoside-diphosphate-sugar epimerase
MSKPNARHPSSPDMDGLRYFNVFGPRQDHEGAYAAVIPKWIASLINGDGETSRDFRAGDVRHSLADISKAHQFFGYQPAMRVGQGLELAMTWYLMAEDVK